MTLSDRIAELIAQHGSMRAAARVLDVDAGYLSRLASGEKDDPGETLLRRMGLRRVVSYERRIQLRANGDEPARSGDAGTAEGTPASSGPDGPVSASLPADLPALLLQAVEALEAIALTEPICAAAYQDAMRIAAALRQRIGRESDA